MAAVVKARKKQVSVSILEKPFLPDLRPHSLKTTLILNFANLAEQVNRIQRHLHLLQLRLNLYLQLSSDVVDNNFAALDTPLLLVPPCT